MTEQTNFPLISIVIPSYNRENYIGEAIESALAQDYPNFEVIVSDNASLDNTDAIVAKYQHDERLKYFKNDKNIGMLGNYKKAAKDLAKGEYITFISSDDYLISNSLLTASFKIIKQHENVVIVVGRNYTYASGERIKQMELPGSIFNQIYMTGTEVFKKIPQWGCFGYGATVYKRDLFLSFKPFESDCMSSDFLINLKIMLVGNVGFNKTPSYIWRLHDNQASQLKTVNAVIDNLAYIIEPYTYAKENNIIKDSELDNWKNQLLYHEIKYHGLRILPVDRKAYDVLLNHYKNNYPLVYKKLMLNIKWRLTSFFFKHPEFSLKFFKLFSKSHYKYLNSIIAAAK